MRVMVLKIVIFLTCLMPAILDAEESSTPNNARCVKASEVFRSALSDDIAEKEKERLYREAVRLCPSYAVAHFNLGLIYYSKGDFTKARESLRRSLDIEISSDTCLALGNVAVGLERFDEANEYYRRAQTSDPDDERALIGLAVVAERKENFTLAAKYLRQAVQKNEKSSATYSSLGRVLEQSGKYDEAKTSYQTAAELSPSEPAVLYDLGRLSESQGNYDEALAAYRKVRLFQEDSLDAVMAIARVYLALEKKDDAENFLEEQKGKLVENPEVAAEAAHMLAQAGIGGYASELIEVALQKEPQNIRILLYAALLSMYQEKLEQADNYLREGLKYRPQDAALLNNLGVILELRGEVEEARRFYLKVLEVEPSNTLAKDNIQRLKKLKQ